jgi:uncharacterized membrane protein YphA (DoxX/SURF4 family)
MNASKGIPHPTGAAGLTWTLARWMLGTVFLYAGLSKALHPVEFLQLVRQYDLVRTPMVLNAIAAWLPWIEVFCGLLLVVGIAVRGTALLLLGMLIPFTALVAWRALALSAANGMPFCAVQFDCGCGTGRVLICGKLAENCLLILLSGALLHWAPRKDAPAIP